MAPKFETPGSKRKLIDGSKVHSSKKPKFEKRPPRREEPEEAVSDDSEISDFSDLDDGGVSLGKGESQNESDLAVRPKSNGDQSGKVFEKG